MYDSVVFFCGPVETESINIYEMGRPGTVVGGCNVL